MTMQQVIRWLIQGISAQTKAEQRFIAETPLVRPTDDEALRKAIATLRAAELTQEGRH